MEHKLPAGVDKIVMSAPFMLLEQFVEQLLDLGCVYLAVLARLAFYEGGTGKQRKHQIGAASGRIRPRAACIPQAPAHDAPGRLGRPQG